MGNFSCSPSCSHPSSACLVPQPTLPFLPPAPPCKGGEPGQEGGLMETLVSWETERLRPQAEGEGDGASGSLPRITRLFKWTVMDLRATLGSDPKGTGRSPPRQRPSDKKKTTHGGWPTALGNPGLGFREGADEKNLRKSA